MKRHFRHTLILICSLSLVITITGFTQIGSATTIIIPNTGLMAIRQLTPTPQPVPGHSVVGSTDWITVMSFVIAAIILLPILWKRRNWTQS